MDYFSHISDPISRTVLIEGYESVVRLGLEELFYQPITEDSYNNPGFMKICSDIFERGGSDHTYTSLNWMCFNLQKIYYDSLNQGKPLFSRPATT